MKMKLKELKNRENFQTEKISIYKTHKYVYNFQQYNTIRAFASNILIINLNDADKDQIELLNKEDH